jgi:hypothetical protein
VPTSTTGPMTIYTASAANAPSGTATTVWYGAQANTSQPSGSGYVDVITLTATGS